MKRSSLEKLRKALKDMVILIETSHEVKGEHAVAVPPNAPQIREARRLLKESPRTRSV